MEKVIFRQRIIALSIFFAKMFPLIYELESVYNITCVLQLVLCKLLVAICFIHGEKS